MKELNHLIKRFKWAKDRNRPIYVEPSDEKALNNLYKILKQNRKPTELEDALILLWVAMFWSKEVEAQKLKLKKKEQNFVELSHPMRLLKDMFIRVDPKDHVINYIYNIVQATNYMANGNDNLITKKEVEDTFNRLLKQIRDKEFPIDKLDKLDLKWR